MAQRQKPKPISDRRLDEVRTECGAFPHILSGDVRCLIARLDETEGELCDLRARFSAVQSDKRYLHVRIEAREREMAALEIEHQTLLREVDALRRSREPRS